MIDIRNLPNLPAESFSQEEPRYYHDPGGRKRRARDRRIDELLAAAGGAKGSIERRYWELVYDHEEAPMTTDAAELRAAGFELPDPTSLDDAALSAKLSELLLELEKMAVHVFNFDHISERELYELLEGRLLLDERADIPLPAAGGWMLDISTICPTEEDRLEMEEEMEMIEMQMKKRDESAQQDREKGSGT